jgi:transposase
MKNNPFDYDDIYSTLDTLFEGDVHVKRIESLSNATLGLMNRAKLGIRSIGNGLAQAKSLNPKHAIKQVDRLLSNKKFDVNEYFGYWVPYHLSNRKKIIVAMDWTEFDKDDQSCLAIHLVTNHGRATPLLWKTVTKSSLKDTQVAIEKQLLRKLREVVPEPVEILVTADRGFGSVDRYRFIEDELGMAYVIRFRENIEVENDKGERRKAGQWVPKNGRTKTLRNAKVTHKDETVGTVVCVKKAGMKDAWCIACSSREITGQQAVKYYSKRWTIEPAFRDTKDFRFGMGLSYVRIRNNDRRDRLLMISAFAITLLTLLGAAGELAGLDKTLKANTSKKRTHSLFNQGCLWYDLIPTMPDVRLKPLMEQFEKLLSEYPFFSKVFECI